MSRELIGFAIIAAICIILTPFYQVEKPKKEKIKKVVQNKANKSVRVDALTKP